MSYQIWTGPPLTFKFKVEPFVKHDNLKPWLSFDGSAVLKGVLPSVFMGKLTGIDAYLSEEITNREVETRLMRLNMTRDRSRMLRGQSKSLALITEPISEEQDFTALSHATAAKVTLMDEFTALSLPPQDACIIIKRAGVRSCQREGNQTDFYQQVYDPVDAVESREQKSEMIFVSNSKIAKNIHGKYGKTYLMPHWHSNYENVIHQRDPRRPLKILFSGERHNEDLIIQLKKEVENVEIISESAPPHYQNYWELQRLLHEKANVGDVVVILRPKNQNASISFDTGEAKIPKQRAITYLERGYFHPKMRKPGLRLFNAWSHRQPAVFAHEWTYFQFSTFWFGPIPGISWKPEIVVEHLKKLLNRTYYEKVATMGYSVSPLFGDSLIHHIPLTVCHNWKRRTKKPQDVNPRLDGVCKYLDEILEFTALSGHDFSSEVFRPGGPIFGKIHPKIDLTEYFSKETITNKEIRAIIGKARENRQQRAKLREQHRIKKEIENNKNEEEDSLVAQLFSWTIE